VNIVNTMKYATARIQAEVFKALAHPARLLMVDALGRGDCSVGDLRKLTRLSQSGISRHAALLKQAGLVAERRLGPNVTYSLQAPHILGTLSQAADVAKAEAQRKSAHL
jgi:DNA-binding transcriptional ArsR family regulator